MSRPTLKELFINAPKRLEVGFYTSSIEKFLQARLLFQDYGLILRHFVSSQEPYHEDYALGQEELLIRAIQEIKHRLGVNSMFFVEDTSVKIDALSTAGTVVPGLEVKEWFARTSFKELDAELRQHGGNRAATIYSDIALHMPDLNRPVFIHGQTSGRVADTPPTFGKSDQYPWLTPKSFNGWFVPDGTTKRLGEMSFEESLEYDFRVRSLTALVARLEEYAAVLNLRGNSYSVKRPRATVVAPTLFDIGETVSVFVVVGKLCAGKTTFGQYASSRHPYRFIEASNIVRMLAEQAGINATNPLSRAKELLQDKGPDIVARQIVGMYGEDLSDGAVITGFRTIEEVQYIRNQFPGCKLIFIDASERTRFERHLRRGRMENIVTLEDFRQHDGQQWQFGLLPVAHHLADVRIDNEGTLPDFHAQIDAVLKGTYETVSGVSDTKPSGKVLRQARVSRCLRALEQLAVPSSCPEIAKLTERDTLPSAPEHVDRISARHVNWILNDVPGLVRRVDVKGDRIRFQILPAGRAYLDMIRSMKD